jgi:hypothetical protein
MTILCQRPQSNPEAMTIDTIQLQPVAIVTLRERDGSIYASIGSALDHAGIADARSLHYRAAADSPQTLVGVAGATSVDGRSNSDARSLVEEGGTNRVAIPPAYLDTVLGIPPDQIDWNAPPQLLLLAGERVVGFEPLSGREIAVNRNIED